MLSFMGRSGFTLTHMHRMCLASQKACCVHPGEVRLVPGANMWASIWFMKAWARAPRSVHLEHWTWKNIGSVAMSCLTLVVFPIESCCLFGFLVISPVCRSLSVDNPAALLLKNDNRTLTQYDSIVDSHVQFCYANTSPPNKSTEQPCPTI